MAATATNKAKYLYATGGIVPGTTDIRMGLLKTLAGHSNVPDINFIADMEAHADFAELTASGYARTAMTGEAATETDASDYAAVDSDNVAFSAISSGETIVGAFIFIHTGSDATASVLSIHDLTSTPTNGGAFTATVADFHRIA